MNIFMHQVHLNSNIYAIYSKYNKFLFLTKRDNIYEHTHIYYLFPNLMTSLLHQQLNLLFFAAYLNLIIFLLLRYYL
jgi:hypothetical protein